MPTAVLSNRLYVREQDVTEEQLDAFTYNLSSREYDEFMKEFVLVEREHRAYKHSARLGRYAFLAGNEGKLRKLFSGFKIDDRRAKPPLGFTLERRFELRPEQMEVTQEWLRHGYGIIHAPVRWGKTVNSIYLMAELGVRTLIVADKTQLLRQWERDIYKFTNLADLEQAAGEPLLGHFTTSGKNKNKLYPITISTFQGLWSQEKRHGFLTKNRDFFGFIIADEAHHQPAQTFGECTATLAARYRCGVTATPHRRDQRHLLLYDILGPIVGRGTTEQLPCRVVKHHTDVTLDSGASWGWMTTLATKSGELNEMVAEQVVKDVEAGRFVIVHTARTAHCHEMRDLIQDINPNITVGVSHGKIKVTKREKQVRGMNAGKLRVIIGAIVVQEGLTINRADTIHIGFAPGVQVQMWDQVTGRVRTPCDGKPMPLIHDWRMKGHGGMYASAKARDKLYVKKKFRVEEVLAGGLGSNDGPSVKRVCVNCVHFFQCKDELGIDTTDTPCASKTRAFTPLKVSITDKLKLTLLNESKVRGEWNLQFLQDLKGQKPAFWSKKQKAILLRNYLEILDKIEAWPSGLLKARGVSLSPAD